MEVLGNGDRRWRFGPGWTESLVLTIGCERKWEGRRRLLATVSGSVRLYGTEGYEDSVEVRSSQDAWADLDDPPTEGDEALIAAAYTGDENAADQLAAVLANYAIEES